MDLKRKREPEEAVTPKRAKVATVQTKLRLLPVVPRPIPSGKFEGKEVKVACWNVNGLRACMVKDVFLKFIERPDLTLLCLNETKLQLLHTPAVKPLLCPHFPHQYFSGGVLLPVPSRMHEENIPLAEL